MGVASPSTSTSSAGSVVDGLIWEPVQPTPNTIVITIIVIAIGVINVRRDSGRCGKAGFVTPGVCCQWLPLNNRVTLRVRIGLRSAGETAKK